MLISIVVIKIAVFKTEKLIRRAVELEICIQIHTRNFSTKT